MDIKSVIRRYGMQLQDVVKKMNVKHSTLSGLLSGNPSRKTLRLVAEAAGCSVAEFFLDKMTPKEVEKMAQELALLQVNSDLTTQDNMPKEELVDSTPISSALVCPHSHRSFVIEVKRQ